MVNPRSLTPTTGTVNDHGRQFPRSSLAGLCHATERRQRTTSRTPARMDARSVSSVTGSPSASTT
jgi:hypothetical protein